MQDVLTDLLQWGQMHELLRQVMQTGKNMQLDNQMFVALQQNLTRTKKEKCNGKTHYTKKTN